MKVFIQSLLLIGAMGLVTVAHAKKSVQVKSSRKPASMACVDFIKGELTTCKENRATRGEIVYSWPENEYQDKRVTVRCWFPDGGEDSRTNGCAPTDDETNGHLETARKNANKAHFERFDF